MARGLGINQTLDRLGPEAVAKTLPDGTDYELTVKRAIPGTNSGGKEKITLIWEVNVGPNFPARPNAQPVPTVGREITTEQYWSPDSAVAVRIFLDTLEKLGATQEWMDSLGRDTTMEDIADRIVGVKVLARVTTDVEWSRNKVQVRKQLSPPLAVRNGGAAAAQKSAGAGGSAGAGSANSAPVAEETLDSTDEWMND